MWLPIREPAFVGVGGEQKENIGLMMVLLHFYNEFLFFL